MPGISERRDEWGLGLDLGLQGAEERRGGETVKHGSSRTPELLLVHPASQERPLVQEMPLLKLVVDYLPSIFISMVNFVLPPVFSLIAPLEGYTRSRQIVFILLRFQSPGVGWG